LAPTVGIATTGFCHPGGILQAFHRQDQQILRLPAAAKSLQQKSSSTMAALCISSSGGILKFFIDKDRHAAIDSTNNPQHQIRSV
jgi:hypothetical protein